REAALHERYDGGRDVRVRHEPDQPALAPGGLFLDLRKRPGEVHRAQLAEDAAPVTPEQHADVVPVVDAAAVLLDQQPVRPAHVLKVGWAAASRPAAEADDEQRADAVGEDHVGYLKCALDDAPPVVLELLPRVVAFMGVAVLQKIPA